MSNPFFSDSELDERDQIRRRGISDIAYSIPWIKKQGSPIFFFGAGDALPEAFDLFVSSGLLPAGILDNNPELWGQARRGVKIYSPADAAKTHPGALTVLAMNLEPGLSQVKRQCADLGLKAVDWLDCAIRSDPIRFEENIEERRDVVAGLELWVDDESREIYRSLIRFRAGYRRDFLPHPSSGRQYFQDFIPAEAWRSFVDAGAYNGDTLRAFRDWTENDFDAYHAFEPMPKPAVALKAVAAGDLRVHITDAALSDHAGSAAMEFRETGSSLAAGGGTMVRLARLDEELAGHAVTAVKMDVEGAEPEVLRGAEGLIRGQRPVLIVCVYHRPDHLWTLPKWIEDLGLGYRLYLRHHSPRAYDSVCYAVPREQSASGGRGTPCRII